MYETRHHPLASPAVFWRRLLAHTATSLALLCASLGVGVLGYHRLEGLAWIDALLNASMLMGGMGPVDPPHTTAGKLFASCYALYCGLVLLIAVGILFAPLLHRFLHRFHLEAAADK